MKTKGYMQRFYAQRDICTPRPTMNQQLRAHELTPRLKRCIVPNEINKHEKEGERGYSQCISRAQEDH